MNDYCFFNERVLPAEFCSLHVILWPHLEAVSFEHLLALASEENT